MKIGVPFAAGTLRQYWSCESYICSEQYGPRLTRYCPVSV
jgi:hypothetical protein